MTAGPVNRAQLEAFFQNPGEIYDDSMTEGAMDVLADQIDDNWGDYAIVKASLNSTTLGSSGTEYVQSPSITGVTGNSAYAQLLSLKAQIDAIVGASIPPGTITYDKLAPAPTSAPTANVIPVRDANGRFQVADPVSASEVANKNFVDTRDVNTFYGPSDTVLVSLPTQRSAGSGSVLKTFYVRNSGTFRVKGDFRSNTGGTLAGVNVDFAGSHIATQVTTTSNVYSSFTTNTSVYVPANTVITLVSQGSATVFVQNVTLCGDSVFGNPNTFGGID